MLRYHWWNHDENKSDIVLRSESRWENPLLEDRGLFVGGDFDDTKPFL
jgi:hypothetical protein